MAQSKDDTKAESPMETKLGKVVLSYYCPEISRKGLQPVALSILGNLHYFGHKCFVRSKSKLFGTKGK